MDVVKHEVAAPSDSFPLPSIQSYAATLAEVVDACVSIVEKASNPVILADIGVSGYQLQPQLRELLTATGYPYATLNMGDYWKKRTLNSSVYMEVLLAKQMCDRKLNRLIVF